MKSMTICMISSISTILCINVGKGKAMYYARFANRTQFPKQNGVEAKKLVKTVRFGQRRLIENWVKYSTRYSVLNR